MLPSLIAENHDEIVICHRLNLITCSLLFCILEDFVACFQEEFILENMSDANDLLTYQMLQKTCMQSIEHISNLQTAHRSK